MELQVCQGFDWGRGARRTIVPLSGSTSREKVPLSLVQTSQAKVFTNFDRLEMVKILKNIPHSAAELNFGDIFED